MSPAVVDKNGTIYIGSNDNKIYAIDKNGKILWDFATKNIITYPPTIGKNGNLYVSAISEGLLALKDM